MAIYMKNSINKQFLLFTSSLIFLCISNNVFAQRIIAKYEEFVAEIEPNMICDKSLSSTIRTTESVNYISKIASLAKLANGVRIALTLECPSLENIYFTGIAKDEIVYKGSALKEEGWLFTGTSIDNDNEVDATSIKVMNARENNDFVNLSTDEKINLLKSFNSGEYSLCDEKIIHRREEDISFLNECESLPGFDELYSISDDIAKSKAKLAGDNSIVPLTQLIKSKYSGEELRNVGLWYLKNAHTHFDFEKAAWYLIVAYKKIGNNSGSGDDTSFDEVLYAGQAAAIAASQYTIKKDKNYDLDRAFVLHYEAGSMGIQTSLIAAAYILRFTDYEKFVKKTGQHPSVLSATEAMLFSKASECDQALITRNLFPFDTQLCNVSRDEMLKAKNRFQQSTNRQLIRNDGRIDSSDGPNLWHILAIIGLAAIAADIGADTSPGSDFERRMDDYKREQKLTQQRINTDMAIWWIMAAE